MLTDLLKLAERCEAATGPDRELDADIWLAISPGATRKVLQIAATTQRRGWEIDETREASGRLVIVPAYTASIDAALSLVPEGCDWSVEWHEGVAYAYVAGIDKNYWGRTPALALCAAALRARSEAAAVGDGQ